MNAIELEQLKSQSILIQYQIQKEAIVKFYQYKISRLSFKYLQKQKEVFEIPSKEVSLLLEEMNEYLEALRKQLGIETLYEPIG